MDNLENKKVSLRLQPLKRFLGLTQLPAPSVPVLFVSGRSALVGNVKGNYPLWNTINIVSGLIHITPGD